jgi:hypothetical protein
MIAAAEPWELSPLRAVAKCEERTNSGRPFRFLIRAIGWL